MANAINKINCFWHIWWPNCKLSSCVLLLKYSIHIMWFGSSSKTMRETNLQISSIPTDEFWIFIDIGKPQNFGIKEDVDRR